MSAAGERSLAEIRARFPALALSTAFLENAGGSQVPDTVVERMRRYLTESYVQLGAGYALANAADAVVTDAHAFARTLLGAGDDPVALGPSSSVLLRLLADAFGERLPAGATVVVGEAGHESNLGPWTALGKRGARVLPWKVDPATGEGNLDDLARLLRDGAAVVALPHVSNLLGGIVDLPAVVKLAHAAGARVVADGVAYAPHRAVDARAWNVDFYAVSLYKVYGPHLAALYGKREAFLSLPGPNHFFIPAHELPYKFELGGASHEACAGLLGTREYLAWLGGGEDDRAGIVRAFARMEELEAPLQRKLVTALAALPGVRIVGPSGHGHDRVPTVSFVREGVRSREIAAAAHRADVGIRHGNMYAWRLCEGMGIDPEDGVVRVSLVHYNTEGEIDRLLEAVTPVLRG